MKAPLQVKPTALGLWLNADGLGRLQLVPELIAAAIYPGEAATELIEEHLILLADAGFLMIYLAEGVEWIQLLRPLKLDQRLAHSTAPAPPDLRARRPIREDSRMFAAVGGARERALAAVRAEDAGVASEWGVWEDELERVERPVRPNVLDAPPIGCPEHPQGRFANCGPCGTARRRHDLWIAQARYTDQLVRFEEVQGVAAYDEEEPF